MKATSTHRNRIFFTKKKLYKKTVQKKLFDRRRSALGARRSDLGARRVENIKKKGFIKKINLVRLFSFHFCFELFFARPHSRTRTNWSSRRRRESTKDVLGISLKNLLCRKQKMNGENKQQMNGRRVRACRGAECESVSWC